MYSDDELRARINQGLMSEAELDAIPFERLQRLAQADMGEQQSRQIQEHQKIQAATDAAERANDAALLAWKNRAPEPVSVEKYENLTALEIEQMEARDRAQAAEAGTPIAQAEAAAVSAEQRAQDALYVAEQMERKNSQQLDSLVAQKVQEQQAVINDSLALQRQWVATHPEYITSAENGDLMRDFVRGNGYQSFTMENLELAFQVLKQQGKIKLLSPEQTMARQPQPPQPRRQASSVSARDNVSEASFYTPKPQKEIDPETIPLDQLRQIIEQNADPNDLKHVARHEQGLGRF